MTFIVMFSLDFYSLFSTVDKVSRILLLKINWRQGFVSYNSGKIVLIISNWPHSMPLADMKSIT